MPARCPFCRAEFAWPLLTRHEPGCIGPVWLLITGQAWELRAAR